MTSGPHLSTVDSTFCWQVLSILVTDIEKSLDASASVGVASVSPSTVESRFLRVVRTLTEAPMTVGGGGGDHGILRFFCRDFFLLLKHIQKNDDPLRSFKIYTHNVC